MENEEIVTEENVETSNQSIEETVETSSVDVKKSKSSKKPKKRLPGTKEMFCSRCGGITKHSLYNAENKTYICLNCNTINK